MTNQMREILIADPGAASLPAMDLYGIGAADAQGKELLQAYNFKAKGNPAKIEICSALWRGCVSTYRLRADGTLALEKFEYPLSGAAPDQVYEVLIGNFWLDMRESFTGAKVGIPFVDGHIIGDATRWTHKEGFHINRLFLALDAEEFASLAISATQAVPHGMKGYKVYVNGNIHGTASNSKHLAPDNGIYTRLKPGAYRVVVREEDHTKVDRAESNTLNVVVEKDVTLRLKLNYAGDALELVREDV